MLVPHSRRGTSSVGRAEVINGSELEGYRSLLQDQLPYHSLSSFHSQQEPREQITRLLKGQIYRRPKCVKVNTMETSGSRKVVCHMAVRSAAAVAVATA